MRGIRGRFMVGGCLLAAFLLWTLLVCTADREAIGPLGSTVGLASLNGALRQWIGVRFGLYTLTDWLGLVPFGVAFGFALLGLVQWIGRKRFFRVDRDLLVLGGFYLVVGAVYLLFEGWTVNYRPVLIEGILEGSYPSSTTLLAISIMPTALMQWNARIKRPLPKVLIAIATVIFTSFMVIGRVLSGVHWASDIIGGLLLGAALVTLYSAAVECVSRNP